MRLPVKSLARPVRRASLGFLVVFLELLGPVISIALAPLFYWRLLVADPRDTAILPTGDITDLHFPYRRWVAEQLARGLQPWWNPYVSGGQSAIGDIQFHTLYPPDLWLANWAGGAFTLRVLEIGIIGHVALAALFTYLLGRRLTGSRVGGLVAAVVFGFGGYLSGFPIQQMIILETSVWLPMIILCIDVGADYHLLTAFVVAAVAVAFAAMAGHPQTLFYVLLASSLYGLHKIWRNRRIQVAVPVGMIVLVFGGLALAAAALLPAYLHLALTDRTNVTYDFSRGGFQLHEALGLILPAGFGGAALYNGVVSLLLVGIALASPFRRSNKLFWLAFGVFGLLLSFGGNTFLQGPFYVALGSFKFRDHERTAYFVGLAVALLAGYGAAELTRFRPPRLDWLSRGAPWLYGVLGAGLALAIVLESTTQNNSNALALLDHLVFGVLVFTLGLGVVVGRGRRILRPWLAGPLIVLIVAIDVFSANWQNNLVPGNPDAFPAASPIASYLENYAVGQFRMSSEGLLPGDGNAGMFYRLEDTVGNSPLETRAYQDFDQGVAEITRWQILDVRYVITKRKLDHPQIHLLRQDGSINLYELDPTLSFPRAYLVGEVVPAGSQTRAFDLLKSVDLRKAAVVENPSSMIVQSLAASVGAFGPTGPPAKAAATNPVVQVTSDAGNTETLLVSTVRPGLLVLSEVDYPGWRATIDGASTRIYRVDGIVRGVYVPTGRHVVQFTFVPPGLSAGENLAARALGWLKLVIAADVALNAIWLAWRMLRRYGLPWRRLKRSRERDSQPHASAS